MTIVCIYGIIVQILTNYYRKFCEYGIILALISHCHTTSCSVSHVINAHYIMCYNLKLMLIYVVIAQ